MAKSTNTTSNAPESAATWEPIGSLVPWGKNPRKNDGEPVDRVAKSIERFGFAAPIVARSSDRVIIAGHTRWKAARKLGMDKVPVRFVDLDPDQAAALALADNRLTEVTPWDDAGLADVLRDLEAAHVDLDGLGWDADALADILKSTEPIEASETDDDVPEVDDGPAVSARGEVYHLGPHRLVCGDCTDAAVWVSVLGDERADAIVTSPPYAVGVDYGEYDDTIEMLRGLIAKASTVWRSVVVDGGFAVVNFGDLISGKSVAGSDEPCEYPMALEYWPPFRAAGWSLWSRRAWCKPNPRCAAPWTASSNRAAADWEHVWTWKMPGAPIASRQNGSNLGWVDTTTLPGVDIGKDIHGAGMPVGAAAWLITSHTRDGGIVAEPFCGTGTTIIAASRTGRIARGVELSPKYCDLIRRRWHRYATEHNLDIGDGLP